MEELIIQDKICPTCNSSKLTGKSTQRYCSVACKNEHHRIAKEMIKELCFRNKRIKRNYIILLGIFGLKSKKIVISEDLLFEFGFDFRAFNSQSKSYGCRVNKIFQFSFKRIGHGKVEITRRSTKQIEYYTEFIERWELEFTEGVITWDLVGGIEVFIARIQSYLNIFLTAKPFNNNRCKLKTIT